MEQKYLLNEHFADNGEHSHWSLIDAKTGIAVWEEGDDDHEHAEIFSRYGHLKSRIGTLGYNTFIHSIEVEEYRAWLRNDRYKHRLDWFEKQYPNGLFYEEEGVKYGVSLETKKFLAEADAAYTPSPAKAEQEGPVSPEDAFKKRFHISHDEPGATEQYQYFAQGFEDGLACLYKDEPVTTLTQYARDHGITDEVLQKLKSKASVWNDQILPHMLKGLFNGWCMGYRAGKESAPKEAGQPRNLPIEELIKLSDEELNVEINKVRSRLGMGKSEEAGRSTEQLTIADYEQVLADNKCLVREIDVILNGDNAAKQASLCDLIPQIRELVQSRERPAGDLSQMLKDYKGTIEYTKLLGGMDFEWSLEKLPVGKQETLYTLQGYKQMIWELDAILYAYEEGARQWEERALEAEAKLKQPVGESAGVWVKATERLPELDKPICFRIYERRYAGKMTQEGIFSHDGYKCTYGVGSVEWLDESQNNKP